MSRFSEWFANTYGCEVSEDLSDYLKDYPEGIASSSVILYSPEDMLAHTEERELGAKGILFLGTGTSLDDIILRVKDGKVFVVDETNYQSVDASFRSLTRFITLLNL